FFFYTAHPTLPLLSFFLYDPATPDPYTLSLHDALPISSTWDMENSTVSVSGSATERTTRWFHEPSDVTSPPSATKVGRPSPSAVPTWPTISHGDAGEPSSLTSGAGVPTGAR